MPVREKSTLLCGEIAFRLGNCHFKNPGCGGQWIEPQKDASEPVRDWLKRWASYNEILCDTGRILENKTEEKQSRWEMERAVNDKVNYKKGYKNEILRLIYLCGLVPCSSLRVLRKDPRMYQRAVKVMEKEGIVIVDKKGGERNIRLLNRRENKRKYEFCLPTEYIDYYEKVAYQCFVKRLSARSNTGTALSAIHSSAAKILMYAAGVDITPDKRDIRTEMIKDEDILYYDSVEIKSAFDYRDKAVTSKEVSGTASKKLQNSRINGVLISPGGVYAVYNIGRSLIKCKYFGEVKMATYITHMARRRSEAEVSGNMPREAIIISRKTELFTKICSKEPESRREESISSLGFVYDRLYAVPEDRNGVLMLCMMKEKSWRKRIFDSILKSSEQENSRYVSVCCDGYDKENGIYKQVFCVPDLVKLNRFVKRAGLERGKSKFIIYCFTCQEAYVAQIVGKEEIAVMSMAIELFYNKFFCKCSNPGHYVRGRNDN